MASEEPRTLLDLACQVGIDAVEEYLATEGVTVEQLFITLNVRGQPGGEPNAAASAAGDALPEDLHERAQMILGFLVGHAVHVGRQIGINVFVAPVGRG